MANRIADYLHVNSQRIVVFEDYLWTKGDDDEDWDWVAYRDSQLLHVISADSSDERIARIIRVASNVPVTIGVMSFVSSTTSLMPMTDIPSEVLLDLAREARCVIVEAYDGEGWVLVEP